MLRRIGVSLVILVSVIGSVASAPYPTLSATLVDPCSGGTLGFWSMHEASGNVIHDICNGFNGSFSQGVAWGNDAEGPYLQFSPGDGPRVEVNASALSLNTALTVELRMQAVGHPYSETCVISQMLRPDGTRGANRWDLKLEGRQLEVWGETGSNGIPNSPFTSFPGGTNQWTHVAFQINGNQVWLYYDGVLRGARTLDSPLTLRSLAAITEFGACERHAGFAGKLQYVRISSGIRNDFLLARPPENQPPTADAGGPYTLPEGGSVVLDASGSSDPNQEKTTLAYEWDLNYDGVTFEVDTTGIQPTVSFPDNFTTRTIAVRVTDSEGLTDLATTTLEVINVEPNINQPIITPEPSLEGNSVTARATFSDPGVNDAPFTCTVNYGDSSGNLPGMVSGNECLGPDHTYADNGSYVVIVSVTDKDNAPGTSLPVTHIVNNTAPIISSVTNDSPISEGDSAKITVVATDPAGANDPLSYEFDCDDNGAYELGPQSDASANCAFADNGNFQVNVRVTDDDGGEEAEATTILVNNVIPAVGAITAPVDPVQVGTEINTSANFIDPGVFDTHTAVWDWGDDSTSPGMVNETAGSGSTSGSHSYSAPGVYTVKVTMTDKDGGSSESIYQFVVVFNPAGGFVTGAGLINSPAGAYTPDPALTGKANFGFVSKYEKGATTPSGQTQFRFKVADLDFHSDTYNWLVVAGHQAQFKGTGTIKGAGNYGFMLTAIDEALTPSTDVDLFRIKIWDKDNGDAIVYDNQIACPDSGDEADPCTAVSGNIVIHQAK